jgi:zinc protease
MFRLSRPSAWARQIPVAIGLGLAAATSAPAQRAILDRAIHTTTLDNGLQVIVVKNSTIPFATVQMAFRAGAFTQVAPADQGLPHLVEHMLFRQGDEGGESTFDRETSKIEAFSNGVTSEETVRYYLTFPAKHLEKGIELMSDLVRKPDFSRAALDAERRVVRGELERRAGEPRLLLAIEGDRLLWSDAGWERKNPGGNLIAIGAATPDRLKELYQQYYVPNNAALIVTGDVSETRVFELATKVFRGWKRGDDPLAKLAPPVVPPLTAIRRGLVNGEVQDVTFLVRWQGPSVGTDRAATYAADVFAGLVNQPLSGTQRRLVDGGHFESVSLSYDTQKYVGPIELYATTSPDRAVAAAAALGAELSKLVAPAYFNADDLVLAKTRQRVVAEFRFESASDFAHTIAEVWSSAGLDYYMDYVENLETQQAEDVQKFVQAYIAGKPMSVNVLLSPTARQSVGTALNGALAGWKVP